MSFLGRLTLKGVKLPVHCGTKLPMILSLRRADQVVSSASYQSFVHCYKLGNCLIYNNGGFWWEIFKKEENCASRYGKSGDRETTLWSRQPEQEDESANSPLQWRGSPGRFTEESCFIPQSPAWLGCEGVLRSAWSAEEVSSPAGRASLGRGLRRTVPESG